MSLLLALMSSLLWGGSDYLGGAATRRLPAVVVVAASQAAALVALVPLAIVLGARPDELLPAVGAGLAGLVGLAAFYAALAAGTMGVVAPIAALGALVPVTVGLARGESPAQVQVLGIVVAVAGVVLSSGPELSGGAGTRPLLLAAVAALGFGLVAVLLADGSQGPAGGVLVTLLVMRVVSVSLLSSVALVRRTPLPRRRDLPVLVAIGMGDVAANACFAVATRGSLLSVVAVLASLYPVVTVLLARRFDGERLRPVQVAGALATLGGVALLAVG